MFGFNFIILELLTCVYYLVLLLPLLFPETIGNENNGEKCIKIVTAAIFCNVAFSALINLSKIIKFIKEKCFRRSAKINQLQTSITSLTSIGSPALKLDAFSK